MKSRLKNKLFENFSLTIEDDFVKEKYEEKLNKALEEKDIGIIAGFIEKGFLEINRDLLKFKDDKGWSVAHRLAFNSNRHNLLKDYYNDKEILMMKDNFEDSVAHWLARNSIKNGWKTNDYDILTLRNEEGETVVHILAELNYENNWTTKDEKILFLKNPLKDNISVAHYLARNSRYTFWYTNDINILKIETKETKETVAHELARKHPFWIPSNKEVLDFKNAKGEIVRDILKFRRKINEKKKLIKR